MPVKIFFGEDEEAIFQAVEELKSSVLDRNWKCFNYNKIQPSQPDAVIKGISQALTPPLGGGGRVIWLEKTTLFSHCTPEQLSFLERTLPAIPEHSVLILTGQLKPDGRLKSTKTLLKYSEVREFPLISPWRMSELVQQVKQTARKMGLKLAGAAPHTLADAVGNDTRRLRRELEKLQVYSSGATLNEEDVIWLVNNTNQSCLQLMEAIGLGQTDRALKIVSELLDRNEPALLIIATLISQFRVLVWVKLLVASGKRDDKAIALITGIGNPKRVYYLKQKVQPINIKQLQSTLPILLQADIDLKIGMKPQFALIPKIIELCGIFAGGRKSTPCTNN